MDFKSVAVGTVVSGAVGIAVGIYLGLALRNPSKSRKLKLVQNEICFELVSRFHFSFLSLNQVSLESRDGDVECLRWCFEISKGAKILIPRFCLPGSILILFLIQQ